MKCTFKLFSEKKKRRQKRHTSIWDCHSNFTIIVFVFDFIQKF